MAQPRVLVLRAPGTNCDVETEFAFVQAGALVERLHVNRLLDEPRLLDRFQILCLPGGFSYGDDLSAGRILANQIRGRLADTLRQFRDSGKLILGICNGFQILIKSGLLFDDEPGRTPAATLTLNASGKFEDRWVRLRRAADKCVFFRNVDQMYLPIAHAEGRFVTRDANTLAELERVGQIALRYETLSGGALAGGQYPDNPNGSAADVAAICDTTGRVCGLMPHPERHIDRTQHPHWTRLASNDRPDGQIVFANAVRYFA